MLKVIEYIKANTNWRSILKEKPYCIDIKDDNEFILLKYSQIESDFSNDIVRECRGLIIDSSYTPVCVPFFKFGNYGESYTDEIDWNSAIVEEKVDGSLIKVWWYKDRWIVSTNSTIFASKANISSDNLPGNVSRYSSFGELFEEAGRIAGLDYGILNKQYTYMFELVSPYNRVIVPYESIDIYHIGTRDNVTLKEMDIQICIKKPKIYQCSNIDDLVMMASALPYNEEGYVVRDSFYHRIKVKSPAYVAVSHILTGLNDKNLLELIRKNETEEFLSYFPEYTSNVIELKRKLSDMEAYLSILINEKIEAIEYPSRKEFAEMATQTLYPAFCFSFYDKKTNNPREWMFSMLNDRLIDQLSRMNT